MKQAILAVVLALTYCLATDAQPGKSKTKMLSLETKLATLDKCGLHLAEPFTVKDVFESERRIYNDGYDQILATMGGNEEEEPNRYFSTNVWYFDTECIYDHGDYKAIAERMVQMSQGSLTLTDIKDYVDLSKNEAWLSFKFKGQETKINFEVADDWVDTSIFKKFVELLNQSDPAKIYLYYDLRGQDCVIACVKKTEFECLKQQRIKFTPL